MGKAQFKPIWRPVLSKEHGASVTAAICFLLGAWMAGDWTNRTTLALVAGLGMFELQFPITRLLRRRRIDTRHILWLGVYGLAASTGSLVLWVQIPSLGRVYATGISVMLLNIFMVWRKRQKSISNELAVFAGLCLSLPLAYAATTGFMTPRIIGLWILCTAYFSSAVFTVRLRLFGSEALTMTVVYLLLCTLVLAGMTRIQLLSPELMMPFSLAVVKALAAYLWLEQYRRVKITYIGFMETALATLFALWVGLAA